MALIHNSLVMMIGWLKEVFSLSRKIEVNEKSKKCIQYSIIVIFFFLDQTRSINFPPPLRKECIIPCLLDAHTKLRGLPDRIRRFTLKRIRIHKSSSDGNLRSFTDKSY